MGQVIIDVPQNVNIKTTIESVEVADEILEIIGKKSNLPDDFEKKTKSDNKNGEFGKAKKNLETIILDLPYDDLDKIDENEVLGIWADNVEEADEIARKVREQNRRTT
ncbi:MAG: hypothetical protein ACR2MD_03250 [Aridibacter sp.]